MAEAKAASPLPSRQLKRMAARALAKELSRVQGLEARREKIMAKRGQRRASKAKILAGAV